eukprot:6426948-Ditylum_brightwellii.AAC.1
MGHHNLERAVFCLKFAFHVSVEEEDKVIGLVLVGSLVFVFSVAVGKLMAAVAVIDALPVSKRGQYNNHVAAKSNLHRCGTKGSVIHCTETKGSDLENVINLIIIGR